MAIDRLSNGKFAKGNKGGPGNPYMAKIDDYKKAMYASVSKKDIKNIIDSMIALAISGNVKAADFIFSYLGLKPKEQIQLNTTLEQTETNPETLRQAFLEKFNRNK